MASMGERQHRWSIWALQKSKIKNQGSWIQFKEVDVKSKRLMKWIDKGVVPAKEVVKLSEEDST